MIKVILCGCNGAMGRTITRLVERDEEAQIVAGVDMNLDDSQGYPVFSSIAECDVAGDVVIDFSHASAVEQIVTDCCAKGLPIVECTTGLSEDTMQVLMDATQKIPVLKSANMSLGINTLLSILKEATKVFAPAGYDIEIVEKHHRLKKDAPSGTALALADAVNEALSEPYTYVYDRSDRLEQRPEKEIGISAVRGGTIVGDHDVIFAGEDEVITFSHTAYSKAVFGKGAIEGAKYLSGRAAGLYDMQDVIAAR